MKARIINYRQGRHTVRQNQVILDMGVDSSEKAKKLLGTKIVFKTKNKMLHGVVSRIHGNSGKVIARFRKGLPGQALGQDAEIVKKEVVKKVEKKPVKKAVKKVEKKAAVKKEVKKVVKKKAPVKKK